jgi:hypothetical protein
VIAEMLFEKLNLILVAAHNDRRRKCLPASPVGFSKKSFCYTIFVTQLGNKVMRLLLKMSFMCY